MPVKKIYAVLVPAFLAIAGIIIVQAFWLKNAWDASKKAFEEKVHIALTRVAEDISSLTRAQLPGTDLISQLSGNYYIVNLSQTIDANNLEFYLKREFESVNLHTDFEYGIYDCHTDQMVYGNYVSNQTDRNNIMNNQLPKYDDFVYYFGVRFPDKSRYLYSVWWLPLLLSAILLLSVFFIIYSMKELIDQRKLSRMQKAFVDNMTHEMKTPLSSLRISAEVLSQSREVTNNPRLKQYVRIMEEQSEHLNHQINRVLEIAATQEGNFRLHKVEFECVTEMENLKNLMLSRHDLDNHQITIQSDTNVRPVFADRMHFGNMIKNILDNAIKYSPDHIEIRIRIYRKKKDLYIMISDKGMGISKTDLDHIGNLFFRVDQGDVHKVKGFGLELHYVKNVCKAHRWKFEIQSEKNKGTTVRIMMPSYER